MNSDSDNKKQRKNRVKQEEEEDDDDIPLSQLKNAPSMSEDSEDEPLSQKSKKSSPKKRKAPPSTSSQESKKVKKEKKKPSTPKIKRETTPLSNGKAKNEEIISTPINKVKKSKKAATPISATPGSDSGIDNVNGNGNGKGNEDGDDDDNEEEEDDGEYKWWEDDKEDDSIKWDTLEHNGVMFPPEYEPLPSHVKLYYDGKPVDLPLASEEVAGFFAALIETDHGKNPVFQKNFFDDFLEVLKESGGANIEIKKFEKCDFTKMFAYFELKKQEKKAMTSAQKKELKAEKEALEAPYKICLLNGRKEQVGNFRVEPPGLFRGRGKHPRTGRLKKRVYPEDIVLNIGKECPIPEPPAGHQWGEIRHDNTVSWLAMWKENVLGNIKYVRFAANSSLKGMSDFKKFEKARQLKNHIEAIRNDYKRLLKDKLMLNRQIATATYLIDVFALRAGGEKSDEEADTVGCCSLRFEHVTLTPPNTVTFDFLGKDSIRFFQEVEVEAQVFKNLKLFKKAPKGPGDDLFDRLDPSVLNKFFQKYMSGLTAKVFRTFNASKTMQDQLDLISNSGTVGEKVIAFNAANRTVAILCNHQRTVSKGHEAAVQKIQDKIKELIWQKIRCKKMILQLDPKLKKKDPKFFEEIDDLTTEDQLTIHKLIIERETNKWKSKFKRENEKKVEEKEEPLPDSVLLDYLKKVDDLKKQYDQEIKKGKPEVPANATVEKLQQQIRKLEERINNTELQLKDKEDNSQVALSTSKINYIDPRLSVVFCKRFDVPIEKIFTKTLRDKFKWAIESVDADWRF